MSQAPLLACPTCGTKVEQTHLGLRDYSRWLSPFLPGKVGGSDIDLVLEQSSTGRMLFVEFKEHGKRLGIGQRMMFQAFRHKGIDVWVVWEYSDGTVRAGEMDMTGEVRFTEKLTPQQLGAKVKSWWYDGLPGNTP